MKWFLFPIVASAMATFPHEDIRYSEDAFVRWISNLAVALLASGTTSFMLWLNG